MRGRSWLIRVPLWMFFGYLPSRYLLDPAYRSIFSGLNLGVHELGHALFGPFGLTVSIAGGTIVQLAVPLFSLWMFARQGDAFALAFSFAWLGTNGFDVARYVADARTMALPLVSLSEDTYHDWNYLLGQVGWLPYDESIAAVVRLASYACLAAAVVYGARVLWLMRRRNVETVDA